ncbi:MAG: hypothetical protein IPM35_24135 [Myxococcales bacterium]|nr:hypothetical protein [Myxococcales bacterium]
MRPLVWLALLSLVSACSSTTENPTGSGGAGSGGSATKSFADCRTECDGSLGSGPAFKAALNTCACLTATTCDGPCDTFCTGAPPTLECFVCKDSAKVGCMTNTCTGDCESYRECLATCALNP